MAQGFGLPLNLARSPSNSKALRTAAAQPGALKPGRGLPASEHPQARPGEDGKGLGNRARLKGSSAQSLKVASCPGAQGAARPSRSGKGPCLDATSGDGGDGESSMSERHVEHHPQPQRCNQRAFVPRRYRDISAHLTSSHLSSSGRAGAASQQRALRCSKKPEIAEAARPKAGKAKLESGVRSFTEGHEETPAAEASGHREVLPFNEAATCATIARQHPKSLGEALSSRASRAARALCMSRARLD